MTIRQKVFEYFHYTQTIHTRWHCFSVCGAYTSALGRGRPAAPVCLTIFTFYLIPETLIKHFKFNFNQIAMPGVQCILLLGVIIWGK